MKVQVPLTVELSDALGLGEWEFKVTCEVSKPDHIYSDERGGFGPVVTDVEPLKAVRDDGTDMTDWVLDWLDADKWRMSDLQEAACIEADAITVFELEQYYDRKRDERWDR